MNNILVSFSQSSCEFHTPQPQGWRGFAVNNFAFMNEYEKTVLEFFAKGIKMAMEERKVGINKLTELTGLSKNSIYKVLRAENYEITVLVKIMRQLQIHLEFSLMDWDNNVNTMGNEPPSLN